MLNENRLLELQDQGFTVDLINCTACTLHTGGDWIRYENLSWDLEGVSKSYSTFYTHDLTWDEDSDPCWNKDYSWEEFYQEYQI